MSTHAFRELYEQYANMVYNLALQYTQNTQDAEEIAQDVFVKIYQKLDDFRKEAQPKTWIYRIAVNASLDFLKAQRTAKRRSFLRLVRLDDTAAAPPVEMDHPGIQLEHKEALEALFRAIRKLPENQQTVLILLKIEALTQAETAAIMKLSPKAVESLFQRAKRNLALILTQNEGL